MLWGSNPPEVIKWSLLDFSGQQQLCKAPNLSGDRMIFFLCCTESIKHTGILFYSIEVKHIEVKYFLIVFKCFTLKEISSTFEIMF